MGLPVNMYNHKRCNVKLSSEKEIMFIKIRKFSNTARQPNYIPYTFNNYSKHYNDTSIKGTLKLAYGLLNSMYGSIADGITASLKFRPVVNQNHSLNSIATICTNTTNIPRFRNLRYFPKGKVMIPPKIARKPMVFEKYGFEMLTGMKME